MIEVDAAWLKERPLPQPGADTDKNKRGRVLAAGGSLTVPGALRLTGEAAFRAGAGKVQIATPESVFVNLGVAMPEAAMFGLPVNDEGELSGAAGDVLAGLLDACDACVIGPGMDKHADTAAILDAVLAHPRNDLALVLDAAMIPEVGHRAAEVRGWQGRLILTPHPGEMAALMECEAKDVCPELAEKAAARFEAIVVLKTPETWIATPGEETLCYSGGGPGLATGGSGDVLAGIITGLLARGVPPPIAAAWGVWLHGEAGRQLAERIGPLGFLGRELLGEVPRLMAP
ncbi:MAG: NAD(P)H-hydrate dehydratase [Alphaproteobacteria bacterium]|nr:MAG: NAD(P)H-hydrate dehydratase [Alphaproteobacteria bacterium]